MSEMSVGMVYLKRDPIPQMITGVISQNSGELSSFYPKKIRKVLLLQNVAALVHYTHGFLGGSNRSFLGLSSSSHE